MIDFTQYDTSYELQSIQLMIEILKPYILFKKPDKGEKVEIYQFMNDKKEQKQLTIKEYIHFIQIKYPKIISDEIETILERNRVETIKKELFDSRRRNGEFKLPLFIGTSDDKGIYEFFIEEFNQKDNQGLSEIKEYYTGDQYKENKDLRDENISYLKELQDFTRLRMEQYRMLSNSLRTLIIICKTFKYLVK